MKYSWKSTRCAIRANRRQVRLGIREEILDQRALIAEVEYELSTMRLEMEAARRQINVNYREQYEREYWDWVEAVEEDFDNFMDDDVDFAPDAAMMAIGDYDDDQ